MKRSWLVLLAVALVPALAAQRPPAAEVADSARARELRARVERRFGELVQQQLRLTPDQATRLEATRDRFEARRWALMERQRDLRRALDDQMQPGIAADDDSVRALMDSLRAGRAELLRIEQEEDRDMAAYLTPVQRARLQIMRQRFNDRVQELRRGRGRGDRMDGPRRGRGPGGRRPGMRG